MMHRVEKIEGGQQAVEGLNPELLVDLVRKILDNDKQ